MPLTIGKAAEIIGVNVQTLRFYEREGLLRRVPRSSAGYRQYSPDLIRRIQFIKHAQEVGFSLREIATLLTLRSDPQGSCNDVQHYAEGKITELEERMNKLRSMKRTLQDLVPRCEDAHPASACPILDAFDEAESNVPRKDTKS